MAKVKIVLEVSDDFAYEEVKFFVDDAGSEKLIASLSTHSDSPEDNNIGRMDVVGQMGRLLKALGHEVTDNYV